MDRELLIEIGCEEIPASWLPGLTKQVGTHLESRLKELRLTAVRALAAGAPREAVWKALTEDAARLSGAGESLGRLAPDCEADFVLWSGDPLDLSSRVVSVIVDGQRVWPAPSAH